MTFPPSALRLPTSVLRHPSSVQDRAGTAVRIIRYFRQLRGGPGNCGETFPYRLTPSGAWASSRPEQLFYFFKKVGLSRFRLFIDLGSGDGGAFFAAALFTRSIGIESDPFLVSRAAHAARDLELHTRAGFICADFLTQRIQEANCLFIYPGKPIDALEKTLESWSGDPSRLRSSFSATTVLPAGEAEVRQGNDVGLPDRINRINRIKGQSQKPPLS